MTNIAQYAINGYEVDAVDYIIRPIGYYDFVLKFQRAVRRATRHANRYLVPDSTAGTRRVKVSGVRYVEVMGHYLSFHGAEEVYRVRANIRDYEQQLRPYGFCQIHKSFLVNMEHIEQICAGEIRMGKMVLPIGRVYKEELLWRYFQFVRG